MRIFWMMFILWCASLCFASGAGEGSGVLLLNTEKNSEDEFHAWLEHPEHIFESNLMKLRVRLFPEANRFPGMAFADVNRFDDVVVQVTVAIEGISVPRWNAQVANRPQSHIEREKRRGRAALVFCRRAVLNASGLLVVAPRYEESDRRVWCRVVLLDEAGKRIDLAERLVKNGLASQEDLDWGRRVPE